MSELHDRQTGNEPNLSPAFSVLFNTLLTFLNPNRKTLATRYRLLQAFLSISGVFEEFFTQFFTQCRPRRNHRLLSADALLPKGLLFLQVRTLRAIGGEPGGRREPQ